jgi:hypothetical protein
VTGFMPAERAALDRATVPPMRPGFAADVIRAATASAPPARRSSRGGWRRRGRVLIGVGALVVASATAAATGLLDRLPIRIPGITHSAPAAVVAPKPAAPRVAHVRPRAKPPVEQGDALALAAPLPAPIDWQRRQQRRAALVAAGLPPALARRPMIARALAEQAGGPPGARRAAVVAEWRRLKALPPAERKVAIAKVRADFLARHPRMAQQYEKRLEARSIAAAGGNPGDAAIASPPPPADVRPPRGWRMARRAARLGDAPPPPPEAPSPAP